MKKTLFVFVRFKAVASIILLWLVVLSCNNIDGVKSADSPYWLYGLFSMSSCQSRFDFSCANALKNEKLMRQTLMENNKILNSRMMFCAEDIGDSQEQLINSLLPAIYQGKLNLTNRCMDKAITGVYNAKALFVYTHITFEMTQLASALLMPYDIPLFAITFQPMFPIQFVEHPVFVYSYKASFGKAIHETGINNFRKALNITMAGILKLSDGERKSSGAAGNATQCRNPGDEQGAFCTYTGLNIAGSCIKERNVDLADANDMKDALEEVLLNPRLSFVLVQGSSNMLNTFRARILSMTDTRVKQLFFLDFETVAIDQAYNSTELTTRSFQRGDNAYNVIYDLPGAMGLNHIMHYAHHLQSHFLSQQFARTLEKFYDLQDLAGILLQTNPRKFRILRFVKLDANLWPMLPTKLKRAIFDQLKYSRELITAYIELFKGLFYVDLLKIEKLLRLSVLNPKTALKAKPYCHLTIPTCIAGTQLMHSYYKEPGWDQSYGYFCMTCAEGFYKNTDGNTKCTPCGPYTKSTGDRKSCYNPYQSVYLNFDQHSQAMLIYTAVACAHGFFIVFTLIMFYRKQFTPLVRTSNRDLSYVQIVTHILLTFIPLWTFSGKPGMVKCVTRPITLGLLFCLTTAINLGKTQKILRIFQMNLRMSRKEIMITRVTEWFIILSVLLLDAAILFVTMLSDSQIGTKATYYENRLVKEYHCNNNVAVIIQYGYVLFIIIINAIQGVRARALPSQYRESLYVMYASFTSVVVLVAAGAIYASQSSENAKTIILLFTGLVMNILHFLLIYSYKLFVLLWRADLNRSSVFRRQRQQKVGHILM